MAKYTYMIEEVLRRSVTVEAEDSKSARKIVSELYDREDIVLSGDDFYEYGLHLQNVDYGDDNEN